MSTWKKVGLFVAVVILIGAAFLAWWFHRLEVAHSSFENYYAFRGCTDLIERTDTYGICKTKSGETIKIVLYEGRWFLDGDLPCSSGICW
jgi:hypothetical protein